MQVFIKIDPGALNVTPEMTISIQSGNILHTFRAVIYSRGDENPAKSMNSSQSKRLETWSLHGNSRIRFTFRFEIAVFREVERQLGKGQFILNSEVKWKVIDRVDQNALYCFEN